MAVRRLADEQPPSFEFTPENLSWAKGKIGDYPDGRQASAVIPILWRAQEQNNGWLPEPAIRLVADMLDMPYIRVFEIATFYTMFQLQPVGSVAHINVCGTTPCMLRGAEDIVAVCQERIAGRPFELSADGRFSWEEVECAGACVNAPMVQIGADTYEDLTAESFGRLLDALAGDGGAEAGPQSARRSSEPVSGATTLTSEQTFEAPSEPAISEDPDALPEKDVPPTTPAAAKEFAAQPDGGGRPEVEAARSGDSDEAAETAAAPADETPDAGADETQKVGADETQKAGAEPPADADENASDPETGTESDTAAEDAGTDDDALSPPDATAAARADAAGKRPQAFSRSEVNVDNLRRISGIGKVIEKTLHDLGIFTFKQMAEWDEGNKEWVNAYLAFKGRIDREKWVEQAQKIVDEARDKS